MKGFIPPRWDQVLTETLLDRARLPFLMGIKNRGEWLENANECQLIAFCGLPGKDVEQFDLSMLIIDRQVTKIQCFLTS